MTSLQVFNSPEFGQVRTTTYNGEIAFVAKDVAERLGYTWSGTSRIEHVPQEWRGVTSVVTPSGTQEMVVLTEQGLYFFLARSDKPLALPYQKWIAGEVIPAIRKHGAYLTPDTIEKVLSDPDTIIRIATDLKKERQLRLTAEAKIATDAPKVAFAERVGDIVEGLGVRELGLKFRQNGAGFGQNELVKKLLDDGYCYRDAKGHLRPYAEYVESGLFWMTTVIIENTNGERKVEQMKFTGKGEQYFTDKYMPLSVEVGGDFPDGYFEEAVA